MKNSLAFAKTSRYLILSLFFSTPVVLYSQSSDSFAGIWVIDHARSNAEFKDYQIICNIQQTASTMTVEQIFQTADGKQTSMTPFVYNLGEKEVSREEQGGTDRVTAKISADRRTVTTRFVRTMNGNDFGSITTYSLSEDGEVLTIKSSDLTGESPMIQVYTKQ